MSPELAHTIAFGLAQEERLLADEARDDARRARLEFRDFVARVDAAVERAKGEER
jgi:hypothetical protein